MPAKKQSQSAAKPAAKNAAQPKQTPKQRRDAEKHRVEAERLTALARAATLNATRENTIPFGAAVTRPQILAVEQFLAKRDILKFLACTEKQLRSYSRNDISFAQLPAKTQERLRQINLCDQSQYAKSWSRKSATITYTLLTERKRRARKSAPKKPAPAPEQPSSE